MSTAAAVLTPIHKTDVSATLFGLDIVLIRTDLSLPQIKDLSF